MLRLEGTLESSGPVIFKYFESSRIHTLKEISTKAQSNRSTLAEERLQTQSSLEPLSPTLAIQLRKLRPTSESDYPRAHGHSVAEPAPRSIPPGPRPVPSLWGHRSLAPSSSALHTQTPLRASKTEGAVAFKILEDTGAWGVPLWDLSNRVEWSRVRCPLPHCHRQLCRVGIMSTLLQEDTVELLMMSGGGRVASRYISSGNSSGFCVVRVPTERKWCLKSNMWGESERPFTKMWVVLRETYKGWWNIRRASNSKQFLPLLDLRRQVKE